MDKKYYKKIYKTPENFTDIIMASDGEVLTYLCFLGHTDARQDILDYSEKDLPIFEETARWLDIYFSGRNPDFVPEYVLENATDFRSEVTEHMLDIKFGEVTTYGDIAKSIAAKRGIKKMSARAVGGAVGSNPISIIVPCHRVIGSGKAITGYGGGINNKIELLKLEGYTDFKL